MMNPSTTPPPGSPLNVPIITVVDTSKERSGEVKPPRPPPPNTNGMPRQVKMTNSGDDGLKWCRCYLIDKAGETMTLHSFKNATRQEEFLSRLFELFDDDEDGQIDQDVLVGRIHARLTETRQAHLAEVIVTAIYAHAFDQFIGKHTFYKILTTKELLDKVFRVIDKESDGFVTIREVMEFLANLTNAKPRIGLTKDNLEYLEQLFRETTKGGDEIHLEDFQKIVKSKNIFFTERVFNVFDRDGSGTVSLQEFLDAINKFAGQSPDDKINFLFRIYDLDGDGLIQDNELRHVIKACMEENGMKFSEEQIEDLTMALFEDADPTGSGAITFEALKAQLAKHEGLLENLSTSIERWLVPPKPEQKTTTQKLQSFLPHQMNWRYMKNNYVFLTFLFLYLGVNAALFISRAYQYRESNEFVILARACGQCLNFTSTMILVFILRNCITWLRSHGFSSYLPLDDHIYFHKLTGALIFFYSVLHTVMHVCNVHVIVDTTPNGTLTVADFLFTTKPGVFGLVPGWAFITGDILLLILVIMVLCSMRFVRKKGNFEVFYWTHQLYVAYWVLLILHGPNFWKWFIGPGIIYVVEKIVRFIRLSTGHGKTYITEGVLLPSRVTHLVIKRPPSFDYHPGDYIFIRIPAIAGYEWHPFTISSAPEQPEFLWLHIRAVGEWTNRLYDYVEQERQRLTSMDSSSVQLSIESSKLNKSNGISIRNDIDGPKPEPRKKKSVHISPRVAILSSMGYENQSFEDDSSSEKTAETELGPEKDPPQRTLIPPTITVPSPASTPSLPIRTKPLHKPLTTSKSMPDVEARIKHREKLLRYRENPRSASELFDQRTLQRARANAGGLGGTTYRSHRDSMAQSFKYLRTKPNVVQLSPVIDNNEEDAEAITPTPLMTGATASTPKITIDESRQDAISVSSSTIIGKPLEVYIDGPFGAPSGYIFRAQHAVLIATGIGVTPFASILQSIMRRYWKERHICPRCNYSWTGEIPQSVMNLRKVDFFWINRDQRSFEWFVNLLSQLEIEQAEQGGAMERFLDMHMYITSALQRADMKAVGLQLALDLLHEREKRDLITGLKTRTQAGRPNWNKVFKQITDQKKGKVIVFYCGPPELGRILQVKCDEFGFTFRKEVF